jgi:hypothetical protein
MKYFSKCRSVWSEVTEMHKKDDEVVDVIDLLEQVSKAMKCAETF